MIGRSLKVLISPGVPFQPEPVQKILATLRAKLNLQIYDCQTQEEAFDALSHFWPDSVILNSQKGLTASSLNSLLRRTADLGGEDQPTVYLLDPEQTDCQASNLYVVTPDNLQGDFLQRHLLDDAKPKKVLPSHTKNATPIGFEYEWMGRTTLTEEGASRTLFAEERFKSLVNNSLDLVCVVEEDGFIKYASQSSFKILGIWPEKLAGRYIQDLLHKCKRNNISRWFTRNKGQAGFTEIRINHTDGHEIILDAACVDLTHDRAIRGYVISARDITSRRAAEQKLTYQGRLLSNIHEAVVGMDSCGDVVYINKAAEKFYKTTTLEAIGKPWTALCQTEWLHPDEEVFAQEAIAEQGQWQGEVFHIVPSTGRRTQVELSITAHKEGPKEMASQVLVIRDIKDRKVVESVLHESENRYRSLVNLTSDLVWHTNENGQLTFISAKVVELLGYTDNELIGHSLIEFLANNQYANPTGQSLAAALEANEPFSYLQGTFLTQSGQVKYLEVSGLPLPSEKGRQIGFHGAIRDVSEQVESERSIRKSLSEKETLIKEIHHRVKNNMQIVSSLLYLQTQFIKDPDMLARLQESQDRIHSMALVHEKLYQSKDLAHIDFNDYLESLARHVSNTYRNRLVHLSIDLPEHVVFIGIDTAVPCGLIVNELLSNAYKHAFAPEEKGVVTIKLTSDEHTAQLEISDTGKGLPKLDIASYESSSLGMQLVDALVHQLHGKLVVQNNQGANFLLEFKL